MPYYIYRITPHGPIRTLNCLTHFEVFKDASVEAKRLRRELELAPGETVKTVFAENQLQAEDLLNQVREAEPLTGDDW